jgi:hypothetical protein
MNIDIMKKTAYLLSSTFLLLSPFALSLNPIQLKNPFSIDDVKWVKTAGASSYTGQAFLTLKKSSKGCAGFGVELLPAVKYSNERILKSYVNNDHG